MDHVIAVAAFKTERLSVENWQGWLAEDSRRLWLETESARVLTPKVLAHLPASMQLVASKTAISTWVDERAAEGSVFLALSENRAKIAGLLFLAQFTEADHPTTIHIGYLLGEESWGMGYATELVSGLVNSVEPDKPVQFVGGVGVENAASAKVLLRSGFTRSEALSDPETDQFVYQAP